MGRRKKKKRKKRFGHWKAVLLTAVCIWLIAEGRFYIPRFIRPPSGVQPITLNLKTTSYCHCGRCCSYNWLLVIPFQKVSPFGFRFKHVGKTSSGAMARPGTIAADTSVFPYGTVMFVPGYGYGVVQDTGGAVKGAHIDLYRPNHAWARWWGVRMKKVKIWLPPERKNDVAVEGTKGN
ncbi:3D domain-containing protein [Pontiellaceae bacterium B12219]|nr:3D domain-containing protein [Pontiellaceae bacterium B12219]